MSDASRLSRRRWLAGLAAWATCGPHGAPVFAREASFPQRPVRLVVPYAVGIGPDVVARSVADQFARAWGQPVVIDNKPGASGIVAFGEVRRTPADGHTLFVADTATLVVNPLLHASTLPYDPQRDLAPLSLLFRATFVVWVGAASRLRTLAELIETARREPGRVSYGSLGNGHASQVAIETFAHAADLRLLHVPFKDAGALFTAVAAGEVDFTAFSMNTVAPLMAAGRMRPLAVAAARRLSTHPEIPTLAEAGGPPVVMQPWAALVTVAGTSPAVLERLQRDLARALASDEVRLRAAQAGFEITPSTPEGLRERVAQDHKLVLPLVREGRLAAT